MHILIIHSYRMPEQCLTFGCFRLLYFILCSTFIIMLYHTTPINGVPSYNFRYSIYKSFSYSLNITLISFTIKSNLTVMCFGVIRSVLSSRLDSKPTIMCNRVLRNVLSNNLTSYYIYIDVCMCMSGESRGWSRRRKMDREAERKRERGRRQRRGREEERSRRSSVGARC
ncbi:unnamed protein product [Camellia sinensis]